MASRADRAKIFLPFNPLKGFTEALEAQEQACIPRPELSEDAAAELDRSLRQTRPGDTVFVMYYASGARRHHPGTVRRIDLQRRRLVLEDAVIPLDDLLELRRMPTEDAP